MAEEPVQRRLAAILAADVVSYSRLTEVAKKGITARLKSLRAAPIDPCAVDGERRPFCKVSDAPSAPSRDPEPG